ncbi:MAG: DUF3072 domain-containing protein [Candidatus Bathyarchaeota archaeon]|nr:DUF3072 domain-containing protein [Candidatus Bathyarchaeota archaeon]
MDNTEEPATEKQKRFLMDLAERKGLQVTATYLEGLTKGNASRTIETLLEGD